ncbi:MAG: preprotein translocase subunit SecA, partial [Clostridiaceae bacterium]|nr:preprotein translocase subunit SecA [Clostridiaceae bacterium]
MASNLLKKLFGDTSAKEIKKITPLVDRIEALEGEYAALTDEQLQAKTPWFQERLAKGETLDDLLPEAFAAMREADRRVLGQFPFRVQLIGGIILHQGRIAEMKTGEGKTLTSTLPAYLNALSGKGVHIVTVNDYLAKYQGEMMGNVYRFMGLKCGIIIHGLTGDQRREAYAADVTYGTNNEMGFDYLRDNMAIYKQDMVQRPFNFAVVDEVDSILIDEARTPLIISGQGDKSTDLYRQADRFARTLTPLRMVEVDEKESQDDIEADYLVDEKANTATITPRGVAKAEAYFGCGNLTDPENSTLMHHINQAIKAHGCMKLDVDYVVKDGEIVIVDEFTGRLMFGRRYSEGLHQAIEAKEGVTVNRESRTLATITFQNYFRMYPKLSGMTGTALTEEDEFRSTYSLDVIEIPTNMPMIRRDLDDQIFRTERGKYMAIIRKIKECHDRQQPVLVGTISIEKSELLSSLLKKEGIKHQVLNAKHHEKEAHIVAQAGRPGAITIATNMAGRGTDIMLGGNAEYMAKEDLAKAGYSDEVIAEASGYAQTDNQEILEARALFREKLAQYKESIRADADLVRKAGGLCIIGTERHESRRIDNQLRGRAGRQGDPGESTFYLSLEDDLMHRFGGDRVQGMMASLKVPEDEPINAKMLSGAIENAQARVEGIHFQSRRTVLEYDNVMNHQREIIYGQRMQVLEGMDVQEQLRSMVRFEIERTVLNASGGHEKLEKLAAGQIAGHYTGVFIASEERNALAVRLEGMTVQEATDWLQTRAKKVYDAKEQALGADIMRELERVVLLRVVDKKWMDHIDAMSELRKGIGLNAYAQIDPLKEYKKLGFEMFESMIEEMKCDAARLIFIAQVNMKREQVAKVTGTSGDGTVQRKPIVKKNKVGRNDPCPCGSGKKYKHCCG